MEVSQFSEDELKIIALILNQLSFKLVDAKKMLAIQDKIQAHIKEPNIEVADAPVADNIIK